MSIAMLSSKAHLMMRVLLEQKSFLQQCTPYFSTIDPIEPFKKCHKKRMHRDSVATKNRSKNVQ